MKMCKQYTGVSCIDGTCPKANIEEYKERCIPVVKNCEYCHFYKGCDDCYFEGTKDCIKKHQMDRLKEEYGFTFPLKATYKRDVNRIYTIMDFDDGEEIEFWGMCEKPSSSAMGYANYISKDKGVRLTNIKEIGNE